MRQYRLHQNVALLEATRHREATDVAGAVTPPPLNTPLAPVTNNSAKAAGLAEGGIPSESRIAPSKVIAPDNGSQLPEREADRHKYEPQTWAPKTRSRGS